MPEKKTVFIPVKPGTDISSFEPSFRLAQTKSIEPGGPQDFTNGPVKYTINSGKTYEVHVAVNNNPIVDGYYADPEILYSNKTSKYYLYPTSDGFIVNLSLKTRPAVRFTMSGSSRDAWFASNVILKAPSV